MIYRALVRDSRDPSKRGRVKVSVPQVFGNQVTDWIWPVVSSGFLVVPKAGDQVWVAFEGGDKENPVWLGKAAVTGSHKTDAGSVGDVSKLLDRIKTLETDVSNLKKDVTKLKSDVSSLKGRVSALEGTSHSH